MQRKKGKEKEKRGKERQRAKRERELAAELVQAIKRERDRNLSQ